MAAGEPGPGADVAWGEPQGVQSRTVVPITRMRRATSSKMSMNSSSRIAAHRCTAPLLYCRFFAYLLRCQRRCARLAAGSAEALLKAWAVAAVSDDAECKSASSPAGKHGTGPADLFVAAVEYCDTIGRERNRLLIQELGPQPLQHGQVLQVLKVLNDASQWMLRVL